MCICSCSPFRNDGAGKRFRRRRGRKFRMLCSVLQFALCAGLLFFARLCHALWLCCGCCRWVPLNSAVAAAAAAAAATPNGQKGTIRIETFVCNAAQLFRYLYVCVCVCENETNSKCIFAFWYFAQNFFWPLRFILLAKFMVSVSHSTVVCSYPIPFVPDCLPVCLP